VDDALRIFNTYVSHEATCPVRVPDVARDRVVAAICSDVGMVDAECFTELQTFVFQTMEKEYFNDFLRSDFYCKHQIDVLTSGNIDLADILYNETALFYFMEYMEQEGNQSLVEFWLAAVNFEQHLRDKKGNYDSVEAQNDAIVLYDKYFSLQATCPLGFSDKIRFYVEHNICREEGPQPDCFRKPADIVFYVLEKNFLKPFLTSELYFKYLSELINTVQSSPSLLPRSRKSGSECGSISIHNTLLAMEDTAPPLRKIIRNVDDREMSIDSRQLYDPDSLWRRRQQTGLNFGRINAMGRFETDIEPEPDRKEESRITKVVKKLVNMEEDKAKEEMAWQIAEMIVKDITSLTLSGSEETHCDPES
jgi:A-kinase anchor protein 10